MALTFGSLMGQPTHVLIDPVSHFWGSFRSRCIEHAVELLSASLEGSAFYGPATEDNLLRLHS